jgi:transposase
MGKATFYVGIDVGMKELVIAADGIKPKRYDNRSAGIDKMWKMIKKIAGDSQLRFCMEATGVYGYRLAISLSQYPQTEVSVVNPAQIAAYARAQLRRTKTDSLDARVILSFAQSQQPPCWKPAPKAMRQLYHLVVQAETLRETASQWSNRAHSYQFIPDLPKEVITANKRLQQSIRRQLDKIESAIERLCQQDRQLNRQVELLCSIPGIASKSAVTILAFGREALTDRSRKALTAHAGLAPAQKQSGISVNGKARIAKQGDRRLRKALFMPALVAAHYNPSIKPFYNRLLDKGKPKMLALTACMNKLLIMIHAILIKNKPFHAKYAIDS